jgi:hypothetical protein
MATSPKSAWLILGAAPHKHPDFPPSGKIGKKGRGILWPAQHMSHVKL